MKKTLLAIILTQLTFISFASPIIGDWHGELSAQSMKLRISFHVTETDDGIYTTMDSPDQGAMGIPTTSSTYIDNTLHVVMENLGVDFSGKLVGGEIDGIFSQGGLDLPLIISKKEVEVIQAKTRPQDPVKPYTYKSEEITFINKPANNIKLAGTLTLPNDIKNPPVAIMITGSGGQNRDEEIKVFNHRPFLVWSDYLTNHGIAVLRYDDRGIAESEGSQKDATSADFATDVQAAVNYLKTRGDVIDTSKIGLIGHSEGGLIAPMVASKNSNIAFIVLLAGTGVDGGEVLRTQAKRAAKLARQNSDYMIFNDKVSKVAFAIIQDQTDLEKLKLELSEYFQQVSKEAPDGMTQEFTGEKLDAQIKSLTSPWLSYFIRTNPDDFLSKVQCPTLALNGSLDFQVLPELNLDGIKKSLKKANNKDVTIKQLNGLNHLFQTATTGAADEYVQIEETVSPIALKLVTSWINNRFGSK